MKIRTRPDDADMLESNELFQMNGWLAELRDEGRAESQDGRRTGSREDSRTWSHEGSQAGSREDEPVESRDDGQARSRGNGRVESRGDGQAGSQSNGRVESWGDGQAGSAANGRARPRDDGQSQPPRRGHSRPEALAATPVATPVTRAQTTTRALIGNQLRLPIAWCEMGSCISWFAHPAALGEADIRARAIDAGWRVDAVGVLACPQCVQSAPGFRSPLPVMLWDREEAIALSAQMADEPSADAVASVAWELSHDLRRPASSHRGEAAAASAWIAAVPAEDVSPGASRGTSEQARRPAGDHQPESRPRPGRHRKRLAARLMFAGK